MLVADVCGLGACLIVLVMRVDDLVCSVRDGCVRRVWGIVARRAAGRVAREISHARDATRPGEALAPF